MKFFNMVRFTKEGRGVEKDVPPKRAFFRFWELVWRKRYKMMGANLLYTAFNLVAIFLVGCIFYVAVSLYHAMGGEGTTLLAFLEGQDVLQDFLFRCLTFFVVFFTSMPIFAIGPFRAGFAYILKSYVKEEPVFLWTDFSTKARSNKKLSIQVCLINALAGFVLMIDFAVYLAISVNTSGAFTGVSTGILFVISLILFFAFFMLLMMNLYLYPMMVTFRVTFKQLYKNAMIFALIKWIPNLLIVLLQVVLIGLPIFLIPGVFAYYVTLFLYVLLTPVFCGFLQTFYVYPVFKKYLIENPLADKSQPSDAGPVKPAEELQQPGGGRFVDGKWESGDQ